MLIQSLEGVITASGAALPTFDQVMAQLNAQVNLDYLFGTGVSPGTGQIGITNLTQLQTYFNAWGDSMIPSSWGDTPNGINGENFNSSMVRFQPFNATNHVFTANSLALTAVNEQLTSFQTSITTGTSNTTFTLPAAVPIATLGLASTASFAATGGTGGVSSVSLVIATVAQGGLYQGNQVSGPGIPAGTHVVNAPVGNGAGTYTLNQAVTVASGSAITSANAPQVGQVLVSMFRGFYEITAVSAGTSLTLAPILNSNGTNIAFNNATVLLPYYYTTLSATLTTGATGASLTSIPAGVVNGMMFSIVNGSSVVSNSTNRITISGTNVTFDNPWTYDEPTFPVGQGVMLMQPVTSGQIWSNTYYLPTATNWVAFDAYVTFPTDSVGGYNMLNSSIAPTITNAAQIAAVPANHPWGATPSHWLYGGNFPVSGEFDNSEVDILTMNYYPDQGAWVNLMGFFNATENATVVSQNPPAVASTTTAFEGQNVFLTGNASLPGSMTLYSGTSLAGPALRASMLWTNTQIQLYLNNVLSVVMNYQWSGSGWGQLGFQNALGTFTSTGRNLSLPLLAANFPSYVTSVSRVRVLGPPATNVLTNGASFTVTGSGFGTKSGSTPTVYDTCQETNLAAGPWNRARSFYTITTANADPWCENYRLPTATTPNGDTWGATTGAVVNPATPFRTKYLCGACMSQNVGGYAAANPQIGYAWSGLAPPYYIVASWYEAFAPNWLFSTPYTGGANDNNNKWMILNNSTTSGSLSGTFWYMEWENSGFTSATAVPSIDIDDVSSDKVGIIPGGGEYHPPAVPNKYYTGINGWVKKEVSMFLTPTQSGFITLTISQPTIPTGGTLAGSPQARTNVYTWNSSTPSSGANGGITDPYAAGTGRSYFIGGFKRDFPQAANRVFWSDLYVDMQTTGVGRFALTDTNSLTTAKCCEWQPYTSWSNSSVTLTCQKGNLASGTVYLWYLDEINGNQLIGSYTMN